MTFKGFRHKLDIISVQEQLYSIQIILLYALAGLNLVDLVLWYDEWQPVERKALMSQTPGEIIAERTL